MSAGVNLRLAREQRGLSREELSARTRISAQVLQAIEDCQFDRLPPLLYLRGFLRSYATEVGLPAGATVERYLAQLQSAEQALTAFASETTIIETTLFERTGLRLVPETVEGDFRSEESPALLPVADAPSRAFTSTHRAIGRGIALAAGVVVIAAAVFAVRSLGPAAPPVTLSAMPSSMSAASAPAPIASEPPVVEEAISAPTVPAASVNVVREDARAASAAAELSTPGLSGTWALTNEVQSTTYRAFQGLQLGYRLSLAQDGAIVTGRGEKWSENGREIPASRRTPIAVAGTLHLGRLELSFTERGTRRSSAGRFVWQISDDGALRGTFVSDAASSRGSSLARRLP
jgi:transcriptional regulator with XRE-family HTH domain